MTTDASNVVLGADLLTISEVAALFGLSGRSAADYVVRRRGFPAPLRTVDPGHIRIWWRPAVLEWAAAVGRRVIIRSGDLPDTGPAGGGVVLTLPVTGSGATGVPIRLQR